MFERLLLTKHLTTKSGSMPAPTTFCIVTQDSDFTERHRKSFGRNTSMNTTATLKIFLVHGDPASLRTAEISNWTGKAVAGPRSQLDAVLQREESNKPGVYFLTGINPETGKERVYIGEAEVIRSRVKGHLDREFWKSISFFVSKDENLTKAHIKYLEGKLIEIARAAGRYEVENSNSSGSHLPEADAADMNIFLARMGQLLPVLGQDFLKPISKPEARLTKQELLFCEIKGLKATGRLTENGFLVLANSEAVLEARPSTQKYPYAATLRSQLLQEAALKAKSDRYIFVKDYEFSSPSAAAAVVHGGSANGLLAWKDERGRSLKELEEKDVTK
jgi:Domain of unknown function (DUF4357)